MWQLDNPSIDYTQLASVLVAAIIPLAVYFLQRHRSLSYEVVSDSSLPGVPKSSGKQIRIKVGPRTFDSVRLLLIRFSYRGNRPIKPDDFHSPIRITFDPEADILAASQIASDSADLRVDRGLELARSPSTLKVQPFLMNAGDTFVLRLLVADSAGTLHVDARIAGVKRLSERRRIVGRNAIAFATYLIGTLSFFLSLYIINLFHLPPLWRYSAPLLPFAILTAGLILYGLSSRRETY